MATSDEFLGDFIALGHELTAWCNSPACRHHARVDLWALVERFGRDLRMVRVFERFRCARCGRKGCSATVAPVKARGYVRGFHW